MPDLVVKSLRGGLNNNDPAIAIGQDQCTAAVNVEFWLSMLGERRAGTVAVALTGDIAATDRVTLLHRHLPTDDETAAQLWALGVTGTSAAKLAYKDTVWNAVTISDTPTLTGFTQYQWDAQSLHAKLFFAYDSNVDRLHVWDGTSMRRTGLAEPAAPTSADTGAGTFSGTRYYRVRYTVQSGGVTLRRSEPSDVLTDAPSGTGSAIRVTKPATINENETHWELEASVDNANFYVIATTVVATTTYDDSTSIVTGYAATFPLSEDIGDYSLIPSGKFLVVDADRLVIGGSWEDGALGSRVTWTPTRNAPGSGNDERLESDTDPSVDLDEYEGGALTGMSQSSAGSIWVFKINRTYKLVRTGARNRAYDVVPISTERGALPGSIINAVDAQGRPAVYFLDSNVGPCSAGAGGLRQCGADIKGTWDTINLDATKVVCSGYFDAQKLQVVWNIAVDGANIPSLSLVLSTDEQREDEAGRAHRGWTTWTGNRAKALCCCMFADNIAAGVARTRNLRPLLGFEGLGLLHLADTGVTDNGVAYAASLTTKPLTPTNIMNMFGVQAATLLTTARTGALLDVRAVRDFGLETKTVSGLSMTATASETQKVLPLNDMAFSELHTVQFTFADPTVPGSAAWEINQLCVKQRGEQTS